MNADAIFKSSGLVICQQGDHGRIFRLFVTQFHTKNKN